MTTFIDDLKHSSDIQARERALKDELLADPMVTEFSSSLWKDVKESLIEHSANPDSDIRKPIAQGVVRFGETISQDEALLQKIDQWIQDAARYLVEEYGHEVEQLIAQTIQRWDAEEASDKIELIVGKDLQFIRINGTIVGGAVGLLIHSFKVIMQVH